MSLLSFALSPLEEERTADLSWKKTLATIRSRKPRLHKRRLTLPLLHEPSAPFPMLLLYK